MLINKQFLCMIMSFIALFDETNFQTDKMHVPKINMQEILLNFQYVNLSFGFLRLYF